MPLTPGTRLGPYEITAPLGAGGMGEVYKARDTRLNRLVAVKQFSERFESEAHAVAALNHSNICTLHDVGPNYLVMEYIEGIPLQGILGLHRTTRSPRSPKVAALTRQDIIKTARSFKWLRQMQKWTTMVEGKEFPARPLVLEAAGVLPNDSTNSHQAVAILKALGFDVRYDGKSV